MLLFCQRKAKECIDDMDLDDRESAELIWRFLELLIKQNGVSMKVTGFSLEIVDKRLQQKLTIWALHQGIPIEPRVKTDQMGHPAFTECKTKVQANFDMSNLLISKTPLVSK